MADRTLSIVRKIMNWHASRTDDFRSPIVRGMARTKPKERARERVLTDDELRAIWAAASEARGPFGHYVQFLLLTATRRNEAARVRRSEIAGSEWTIPGPRYKTGKDHVVPLSAAAQAVLDQLPPTEGFLSQPLAERSRLLPSGSSRRTSTRWCLCRGGPG